MHSFDVFEDWQLAFCTFSCHLVWFTLVWFGQNVRAQHQLNQLSLIGITSTAACDGFTLDHNRIPIATEKEHHQTPAGTIVRI